MYSTTRGHYSSVIGLGAREEARKTLKRFGMCEPKAQRCDIRIRATKNGRGQAGESYVSLQANFEDEGI
ncbi:MAG: hypothetical protein DMG72_01010 [Acidobacteria bacterium]|nr:MAG: hypothetical protein DMG72_01010 [Acidobacteriota bacterium]